MLALVSIEDERMTRSLVQREPFKWSIILVILVVIVCMSIVLPFQCVTGQTDQNQNYDRQFAWYFDGYHWVWNLSIPESLYNAYVSVPDSVRTQISLSNFGYFVTTDDSYIQGLASKLNATASQLNFDSVQEINFVLSFVQSIPYATDANSTGYQDYPRFPIETLVDNVGDCKSHSILFASLTLSLGYGSIFINPPNHLAVGVLGNDLPGSSWTYDNQMYYYCETTGSGFTIGVLPDQFDGQSANIFSIDTGQQYIPILQSPSYTQPDPTIVPDNPYNSIATPTPNPDQTFAPVILQPTIQPDEPISVNLIADEPIFFVIIVTAIAVSIAVTILSVRMPKQKVIQPQQPTSQSGASPTPQPPAETSKFCIYCGASNKSIAIYCETCGKKIG